MARDFVLPDLGEGLTEAEIRQVLVREGEVVREDAPLLEVETDKATVEIPSPFGGRVEKIHVRPGQTVKVGQTLVTFGEGGAPARQAGRRHARSHPHAGAGAEDRGRRERARPGGRGAAEAAADARARCPPRLRRDGWRASWASISAR